MLSVIGGLLVIVSIGFFIAMLVGLAFPKLFSRKSAEPSRVRVFKRQGLYTVGSFFIGVILIVTTSEDKTVETAKETTQVEDAPAQAEVAKTDIKIAEKTPEKIVEKSVTDSTAMYKGIEDRVSYAKQSFIEAKREFDRENYEKAKEILKNTPFIQGEGEILIIPPFEGKNPILKVAWNTQGSLSGLSYDIDVAKREIEYESKHWLKYPKGSFERSIEMLLLNWYFVAINMNDDSVFDYTYLKYGSKRSIIKKIDFSNGKLSILMRADPDDFVDVNYRTREAKFKHPIKFMGEFRRTVSNMWTSSFDYQRNKYSEIDEIEFSLYYQGATRGTETVIAKFGLSRSAVQSVNFRRL